MACPAEEHAVETAVLGPMRPNSIDTVPDAELAIILGIVNGFIRPGPPLRLIRSSPGHRCPGPPDLEPIGLRAVAARPACDRHLDDPVSPVRCDGVRHGLLPRPSLSIELLKNVAV